VNAFFHWFGKLHRRVYALDGRFGRRFAWVPCLVLTTTGRRSGARRASVLAYADDRDGGGRVVVASNGGSDRPPGWLCNVQADPAVQVQVGNDRYDATARVVTADDTDFARLWLLVNSVNGQRYDAYQSMTERAIAMVVLDRVVDRHASERVPTLNA
jgi:deazaflavin-dependent oxidoreductase (nitroreductase family)